MQKPKRITLNEAQYRTLASLNFEGKHVYCPGHHSATLRKLHELGLFDQNRYLTSFGKEVLLDHARRRDVSPELLAFYEAVPVLN